MRGLDRTTEHRLRLPAEEFREHVLDPQLAVTILSGEALHPLKPYFSQSEYDRLERVALVPFGEGERLFGLLLIAESAYLAESPKLLDVAFSAISRPITVLLRENREERLFPAQDRAILDEDEFRALASELQRPESDNIVFIGFDISNVVAHIAGQADDVDRFRIRQDVLRVVSVLVSEIATIGTSSSGRVILMLPGTGVADPDIVLHQIALQIAQLFDEIDSMPALAPVIREVDHETERVEEVLSELV
ncbi:MAG: hypothetical protein ACQETQ_02585 [Spirochaetota bacterium]